MVDRRIVPVILADVVSETAISEGHCEYRFDVNTRSDMIVLKAHILMSRSHRAVLRKAYSTTIETSAEARFLKSRTASVFMPSEWQGSICSLRPIISLRSTHRSTRTFESYAAIMKSVLAIRVKLL